MVARLPEIARVVGDADLLVEALIVVGHHAYWHSDLIGERAAYEEAVNEGRRSHSKTLSGALSRLGHSLARRQGRFTEAEASERERDGLTPPELSKPGQAWWSGVTAESRLLAGDFEGAVQAAERGLGLAREAALPFFLIFALWKVGEIALARRATADRRDLQRARALLEEGAQIAGRLRARGQIPELSARAASACVRLGDLVSGRRHLADAKDALMERDLESLGVTATAEAELASAEGDRGTAERVMREAIAKLDGSGFGWDLALLRLAYGELLAGWGRTEDARAELGHARAFFRDPLAEGWRRRIDAVLAAGAVHTT